mgnify:CR=1 FL=1
MNKKICLITGGTRGLGRVISLSLHKKGHIVIANYIKGEPEAQTLRELGCITFKADISKMDECIRMADFIKERFGILHVLINNAAILKDELLIKLKENAWDEVINVNLKGMFNTILTFSALLAETKGHIINITSYSGIRGKAGQTAYSASKAGVIGLSLSAAKELSMQGIKVNVLAPGYMDTDMGRSSPKALENAIKESLLNTLTNPEEVAEFIAFLINTETITGQIFRIDNRI